MIRFSALALFCSLSASAAPRDFAFTWDSQTLEQGKAEAYFELTPRIGGREYHARFDSNAGAVLGITRALEAHLGLDTSFQFDGVNANPSGSGHVTTQWRYHFLDPKDPLGFVIQLKLSAGFDDGVIGGRFIVDYRFTHVRLSFNAALERTIFFRDQKGINTRAEEALAVGYQLNNTLTPAFELVAQQSMTDNTFGGSAFFVAGSLTYRAKWGWFSLGLLTQVAAVKPDADVGDGEQLELRDHERFLFRFAIGVDAI